MSLTHRFLAPLGGMILGGLLLVAPGEAQKKKEPDQDTRIRVNVEMVSLPVVVTTREGKRVTDLVQQDFEVFEDGVPQEIAGFSPTDEPISVALLLDTSGSTEQRLARIQNEAIRFVNFCTPTILLPCSRLRTTSVFMKTSAWTAIATPAELKRPVREEARCFMKGSGCLWRRF